VARVTKEPEVRRDELLDVALGLCTTVGFDAMSVEQITTAAGVAKGTFYHYFTSKQDLMWQLVNRFGDELFSHLEERMANASGTALDRMKALLAASASWKMRQIDSAMSYLPFLYKEDNYALRHKLFSMWLERTRPLLFRIIQQGTEDGTFDVTDVDGATSVILGLWFDSANRLWERAIAAPDDDGFVAALVSGTRGIWQAQERILGVAPGTLQVDVDPAMLRGLRAPFLEQVYGAHNAPRTA
jgi:AcrR family transcriptional regulator